jgi:PBP1b-binding outer membrane lipoprotein LpoB
MKKFLSIAFLVLVIGCGGKTRYEDVNKAEGSMEWGPKEIKTTVDKMVSSLYTYLKDDWKKPAFIQVKKFRNMTSEHIDTELVVGEIRTRLIRQRIKFIDDSLDQEALEEIAKGQTGLIDADSAIPVGEMKSPNFYLTGDIRENVRYVDGRKKQYLKVTLKLINIRTRITEWQDEQEFLKSTKTDRISW